MPMRAREAIGAHERLDRRHLGSVQAPLLLHRRIGIADPQPARRQLEVGRQDDPGPLGIDPHRRARLHRLRDRLEADPAARVARQREAQDAEVQVLLDSRRIDHGNHRGGKDLLALMRQGRGLRAVIVAGEHDDAAMRRGAGRIAVLQHVHRAVDARALAVPDGEHAIDGGAGEQVDLLRTPDGRGAQVLVEAGLEVDVVFLEVLFRAPQRVVIHAERRAAITGDEAAGVEAGLEVALALHHRQADQRLDAGEVDAALVEAVAVLERVVTEDERDRGVGAAHRKALRSRPKSCAA
jgi:hypothetical protein